MDTFKAKIGIIGINPFVLLPELILESLHLQANRIKGPIPVKGTIDGYKFTQTLVKYAGEWRLYINEKMLKATDKKVGEEITISIIFDPAERKISMHPKFRAALENNFKAKEIFDGLSSSRQKEILRYIANLKSETAVTNNVEKAVGFLLGKNRFVGRSKP